MAMEMKPKEAKNEEARRFNVAEEVLPYELWFGIAMLLRDPRQIAKFGEVCRCWNRVTKDTDLWRALLRRDFPRAPLQELLELQERSKKSLDAAAAAVAASSSRVFDAHERVYRELYLEIRSSQSTRGGSNQRLGYYPGTGIALDRTPFWEHSYNPKQLQCRNAELLAWYSEQVANKEGRQCFEISTAVVFESNLLIIERPNTTTDWEHRTLLRVIDLISGVLLQSFLIDIPPLYSFTVTAFSIGISRQHRLLLLAVPGSLNAYSLDAILALLPSRPRDGSESPSSASVPSPRTTSSSPVPLVLSSSSPFIVWSVSWTHSSAQRTYCTTEMAVVELHNRVYIVIESSRLPRLLLTPGLRDDLEPPKQHILGIALCPSRSDEQGIDDEKLRRKRLSCQGTSIVWCSRFSGSGRNKTLAVSVEDDVMAFGLDRGLAIVRNLLSRTGLQRNELVINSKVTEYSTFSIFKGAIYEWRGGALNIYSLDGELLLEYSRDGPRVPRPGFIQPELEFAGVFIGKDGGVTALDVSNLDLSTNTPHSPRSPPPRFSILKTLHPDELNFFHKSWGQSVMSAATDNIVYLLRADDYLTCIDMKKGEVATLAEIAHYYRCDTTSLPLLIPIPRRIARGSASPRERGGLLIVSKHAVLKFGELAFRV